MNSQNNGNTIKSVENVINTHEALIARHEELLKRHYEGLYNFDNSADYSKILKDHERRIKYLEQKIYELSNKK